MIQLLDVFSGYGRGRSSFVKQAKLRRFFNCGRKVIWHLFHTFSAFKAQSRCFHPDAFLISFFSIFFDVQFSRT